jgi:hypothetical protein
MAYVVKIFTDEYDGGIPVARSHTIEGNVQEGGRNVPDAEIRIIEPEVRDEGSGRTDRDGNFSVRIHEDTMHHMFVNGIDSQLVKVITG